MRSAIIFVMLISACSGPQSNNALPANSQVDPKAEYLTDYLPGGMLTVSRMGVPFTHSDGLAAKQVATGFCKTVHAQLNPATLGHFNAGAWEFKEGCA